MTKTENLCNKNNGMKIVKINKTKLYGDIGSDFLKSNEKFLAKTIKKKQSEYENKNYPENKIDTSMICVFCGGNYTKRSRSIHNKTNKHMRSLVPLRKHLKMN